MTVKICGIPYEVKEVEQPFLMADFQLGEIDYASCEIKINKTLNENLKTEVLCHEIVHGILHHLGYEEENDEKMVQQLANAINQTFYVKGEKDESDKRA